MSTGKEWIPTLLVDHCPTVSAVAHIMYPVEVADFPAPIFEYKLSFSHV
jgi:hypothetical protein